MTALAFASYVLGLFLSIRGSSNAAGVISLLTPLHVVLTFSWAFSWQAGVHLMLLTGASAVFTALSPEWRGVRAAVVVANVVTFAGVQAFATPETAWYPLPVGVNRVLFTINAVAAATLLYLFAGAVQSRSERAQQLATLALKHAGDLAETDALTGLANRRPALAKLDELSRIGRRKYCLAILDLDHFKQLNDQYGHTCGDFVLSAVGHELGEAVRDADTVARWGGEEFLVLLPDTGLDDAARLMERVRHRRRRDRGLLRPAPSPRHDLDRRRRGDGRRALRGGDQAGGRRALRGEAVGTEPGQGAPGTGSGRYRPRMMAATADARIHAPSTVSTTIPSSSMSNS